jgi:hypothetical protein
MIESASCVNIVYNEVYFSEWTAVYQCVFGLLGESLLGYL